MELPEAPAEAPASTDAPDGAPPEDRDAGAAP